jgi:hypothetical protein
MISLDKVDGELILKSNGRYFEWIKGFQKAAASKGLLGIFGFGGAMEVYKPVVHEDIMKKVTDEVGLSATEMATWNSYNTQVGEYERNCSKALMLVEMYVSKEIWERIQVQVVEWDKPHHQKLREIIQSLKKGQGGVYNSFRDAENRRAIDDLPYFTDYHSVVQCLSKLRNLLLERQMWEDNRNSAQLLAAVTYMPSKTSMNNWLSQRLMGTSGPITTLRNIIDQNLHSFDTNATSVVEAFEKVEVEREKESAVRARLGGQVASNHMNMSFAAVEHGGDMANFVGKQRFGVKLHTTSGQDVKRRGPSSSDAVFCYRCRKPGHKSSACMIPESKVTKCYACGGLGHLFRECPNTKARSMGEAKRFPQMSGNSKKREFVTIRNSDGSPRDKIMRKDVPAYHGLMEELHMYDEGAGQGDSDVEDEDDVLLRREDEVAHDQVMAHFGAGTDM